MEKYQVVIILDESKDKKYFYSYSEDENEKGNITTDKLPPYQDINKARACYWDNIASNWIFDEKKYSEILSELNINAKKVKSLEEVRREKEEEFVRACDNAQQSGTMYNGQWYTYDESSRRDMIKLLEDKSLLRKVNTTDYEQLSFEELIMLTSCMEINSKYHSNYFNRLNEMLHEKQTIEEIEEMYYGMDLDSGQMEILLHRQERYVKKVNEYFNSFKSMRNFMLRAMNKLTDDEAVDCMYLFNSWDDIEVGKWLEEGKLLRYDGNLYKVSSEHAKLSDNNPRDRNDLFEILGVEEEGTLNNPIVWSRGMVCEKGKFYIQNEIAYECVDTSYIPLFNDLKFLGAYFVEV